MVRFATTPFLNPEPIMITVTLLVLNAEVGEIVVIVGEAFVTLKASVRVLDCPSVFVTTTEYALTGAPVKAKEQSIEVLLWDVIEPGMLKVPFVRATEAAVVKIVPVMFACTDTLLLPELGVIL